MNTAATYIAESASTEGLERALRVLSKYSASGKEAVSQYASCLIPLLNALGWSGRAQHVAEAIPHFLDDIDINDFRTTLANLNYNSVPLRCSLDRLNPGLLPCLFVADKGFVCVVLGREGNGYSVFDGLTRQVQATSGRGVRGTAYVVREGADQKPLQQDDAGWMAELLVRFRRLVLQVLTITLMINLLSIAMPLFMMAIYDVVIPSSSVSQLVFLAVGVVAAIVFEWLFRRLRSSVLAHAAGRIDYIIGTAGFRQVLMMPIAMTENEAIGAQLSHLQEFESIREFFAGALGETFVDLPFALLFLALIAVLSGWLVMVPIVSALLLILCAFLVSPLIRRAYGKASRGRTLQQRFLIEAVSGMKAIKFAGAEGVWMERFRTVSATTAVGDFHIAMINQGMQTFGRMVMMGSGVALVGFGAVMAMNGDITIGALVACMALGWRVLGPFQSILMLLNQGTQIKSSLRQINHLMRLKPERLPGRIPPKRGVQGKIAFNGVVYRHTPESDPALGGVSFVVEPGEVVAITGPNGAGKTTVVNLAAGLYKAQMGSVMIDGIDVRQIDTIDIRQNIGLVPQHSELLYGTVSQNLRLSMPWASDEEIEESAKLAAVHEAIMALPEGYETRLTETVVSELPEGFKAKLSIARALLRKPPVLIFDEPGQMLDERGDAAFMSTVEKLRGQTTIIVVTHRPSHMKMADRLIVLNTGRLQFNGPPSDVMEQLGGQGA
jgi:ATP-binding cassette subfamily C protein/ATP-binding cassette subfamily C protein LapB